MGTHLVHGPPSQAQSGRQAAQPELQHGMPQARLLLPAAGSCCQPAYPLRALLREYHHAPRRAHAAADCAQRGACDRRCRAAEGARLKVRP